MAGVNRTTEDSGGQAHGLRFLNDQWNNTIVSGESFMLQWNATVNPRDSELGLFKITYPEDGMVVYQLASNLTHYMGPQSCDWKPRSLDDGLYALWLSSGREDDKIWTISPPWIPDKPKLRSFTWAAPFLVPICVLLFVYFTCLSTCLIYRKKKKKKREQEAAANRTRADAAESSETQAEQTDILLQTPSRDRNTSVDSAFRVEMLEPPEGPTKPGVWLITARTHRTQRTQAGSSTSDETAVSGSSQAAGHRAAHQRAIADSSVRFVRSS